MKVKTVDITKLITPSEFAKKHRISRGTAYNWIKEKAVKSIQICNSIFIVEE